MTKKVAEYDLKSISDEVLSKVAFPEDMDKSKYELDMKLVIIEGKDGQFIASVEREGVHSIFKKGEMVTCDVREKPTKEPDGSTTWVGCFPFGTLKLRLEIIKKAAKTEIELKDAVRTFGSRLDVNYSLLLDSCKKIGIDLSEYDTKRR